MKTTHPIMVPLSKLKGNPDNPRILRDEKFLKLKKSISDFPDMLNYRAIVAVSQEDGTYMVLGGNMRLKALQDLKIKEAPVMLADHWTEEQRREFVIKDNVGFGEWDWEDLANEWDGEQLQEWGLDLPVDFGAETNEGLTDPDEVPEVPETPVTVLGDVWVMGKHRVMCGDSCLPNDVARLMEGKLADMLFTDPPWNVNYGAVDQGDAQGCKVRTIINDHMTPDKWAAFVGGFTEQFRAATKPGAPAYVVMSAQEWPIVDGAIRNVGFHWSSTIIWVKDSLVLSRKDYHTRYEPIWYGWNEAAPRIVQVTDRKQDDVWEINRPKVSELHPTTKPVELIERALKNSSHSGAIVLDLFGGSGSTLIACEAQGREARLMELDPKYADVIVKRWEAFTGTKAIHEATGRTFDEVANLVTNPEPTP
jgi:DNA modification methylase